MKKNIAVIGCGYWGKNHIRNLYEMGALGLICDDDPLILEEHGKVYNDIRSTTDMDEVFADPSIEGVVISTPAVTHKEIARKAMLSDKDVLVEKPMAMKQGEAESLIKVSEEKEKILMVGHIVRYHPASIKLKEIIVEGKLGKVQYLYSRRLNMGKLRTEENILWSFAPHDISMMLMLTGGEPEDVRSFGGDYLNRGIYDITVTLLEFANGVKGHIFVSWLHPFKEQKIVVVGSEAMAVFDDMAEHKLVVYPHKVEWKDGKIPVAHKADRDVIETGKEEPLRAELTHFLKCMSGRMRPLTDGGEALKVLKVLERAEADLG